MIIIYCIWLFSTKFILYKETVNAEHIVTSVNRKCGKFIAFFENEIISVVKLACYSGWKDVYNAVIECGKSRVLTVPRIVGGMEAQAHSYPWMAALYTREKVFCGASLINNRYVLTAGHCVVWIKKENLWVILGLHDKLPAERSRRGGIFMAVERILIHENFKSFDVFDTNDIALIKLTEEVTFNENIRPVCLPFENGSTYEQKVAIITGWGKTASDSSLSQTRRYLKETNVRVLSNEECSHVREMENRLLNSMLCAYKNSTDACQGDSGGPLIILNQRKAVQIGIVSWGIGCAEPGIPGVFSRVTSFLPWIISRTKDAVYCI